MGGGVDNAKKQNKIKQQQIGEHQNKATEETTTATPKKFTMN